MSCALCRLARTACNKEQPCGRCIRMGMAHHCFRPPSKRGRPPSRTSRLSENQPVPLLPLHPAGHAGGGTEPLASGAGAPHLVPTATLFAAGMGTLPVVHSDYDGTLTSTTTSSASMAMTTSMASSSMVRGGTYQGATEGQDQTSALVLGSISEVKNELAEVKDELHSVHMMKAEMREMKRRLEQLEEDNSQLKGAVIELRTQTGSGNPTRPRQFRVEVSQGQQGQGPPLKKIRWMGYEALSPEMLWCFPFLENINISRSNFVVDDLEKAILVLSFYPGKWTESTAFANQQFCNVSGFSLAELLERELVSVVTMADKLRIVRGWIKGKLTGYGDIVHCNYYIENKAGHLVNVAARLQFFFDSTTQINYSVWCIDEVLGIEMPSIPFKEVRAKEMAEWHEASRSIAGNPAVAAIQPAAAAAAAAANVASPPVPHQPTPPQHQTPPSQPSPQHYPHPHSSQQQHQSQQHSPTYQHPHPHSYPQPPHPPQEHSPTYQHQHQHQHQHPQPHQHPQQSQPQPPQHSPSYHNHHQHHHQHAQHSQSPHQHSHQPEQHSPSYLQQHQQQHQQHQPSYQQHQVQGQAQEPYTHAHHLQQQLQLKQQQHDQRHHPYQLYQQQQQQQLQLLLMQHDEIELSQQQQQHQHQLAPPTTADVDEWREFLAISPSPSPGGAFPFQPPS